MIALRYFPTNQAFAFVSGRIDDPAGTLQMFRMGDQPMFFRNKRDAVKAAERQGLRVNKEGRVVRPEDLEGVRGERKFDYLWVLQGHYGQHGWEDLTASENRSEVRQNLKEYRENEGGRYRIIRRRVRREGLSGVRGSNEDLDEFTQAYIEAALWSTNDESDESGGVPLDENYGPEDLAPEALARMVKDAKKFQRDNARDINDGWFGLGAEEQAGYDFWLTRNRHGAGFWDGDWKEPQATRLREAAQKYGEVDLYVGDDGQIHIG